VKNSIRDNEQRKAGIPTIKRLPQYLRILKDLEKQDVETVSTTFLAQELNIEPIVVRKDIASTGAEGKPRIGFTTKEAIKKIEHFLGWDNVTEAFLVGAGNLGSALMGYQGFQNHGLKIIAAFDKDDKKIGQEIHGIKVLSMEKLPNLAKRMHIHIGVICVDAEHAQEVSDIMVEAGIKAIWNFTPVKLKTPDDVVSQKEDLSSGLAVLSVKLASKLGFVDIEEV